MQFILKYVQEQAEQLGASKGLHMVSAVHQPIKVFWSTIAHASKGLHMVSAVHPHLAHLIHLSLLASKGLHMVSAVHLVISFIMWSIMSICFKGAAHG